MMECPKCNSKMLTEFYKEKYLYGVCQKCSGRWISGTTLGEYSASMICDGEDKVFKHFMQHPVKVTDIKCPACKLKNLTLVHVNQIEVEFCTHCQGVFFDYDEMHQAMPDEGMGTNKESDDIGDDVTDAAVEGFFEWLGELFD